MTSSENSPCPECADKHKWNCSICSGSVEFISAQLRHYADRVPEHIRYCQIEPHILITAAAVIESQAAQLINAGHTPFKPALHQPPNWMKPMEERMSRCTSCGERYPTAPPGYLHKCGKCSDGMCAPETSINEQLVPVEQIDRDLRGAILSYLVERLGEPCSDGDMPDDRSEELDRIIARHRLAALRTPPAVEPDGGLVEPADGEVRDLILNLRINARASSASKRVCQLMEDAADVMERHRLTHSPAPSAIIERLEGEV